MTTIVQTKTADRRPLRFARVSEIAIEVDRLHGVQQAGGTLRASGNWSAAQNVYHVARIVEMSLDGFPRPAPLAIRICARLLKSSVLNKPMKPGYKIPRVLAEAVPPDDVTWAQAIERLHRTVQRVGAGERMAHPSPAFGRLSHEEWEQLHCRHAELHLGFIHPEV